MNRMLVRLVVLLTLVGAGPTIASAQSLAGTVRDTSGAVLPGVTVEASSPALIAKVRTSVTDDTGQFASPICRLAPIRSASPCLVSPRSYARVSS